MPAAVKNLTIEQKATFKKRFTYRDKNKRPINLTGFAARMHIRDASGALLNELSTENGKIVLGGASGTINLTIPVEETSLFMPASFAVALYDLKLIAPDATEDRLLQGKVTLSPGQTA